MTARIINENDLHFNTIEEVLNHKFVGNYEADADAIDAINEFIMREDISDEDKLKAHNHVSVNGMGVPASTMDEFLESIS